MRHNIQLTAASIDKILELLGREITEIESGERNPDNNSGQEVARNDALITDIKAQFLGI